MMTLATYVSQCQLLKELFESIGGVPESLVPPQWQPSGHDDTNEMAVFYRKFFVVHCNSIPEIPMAEIVGSWDAISFMNTDELLTWLPIFMAGSLYAEFVQDDSAHNAGYFTVMQIEKLYLKGIIQYEPRLLLAFIVTTNNEREFNNDMMEYLRREAGA